MFSVAKSSRFSRVVLASGSPRRKEILMNKGVCLYECIVKYSLSILALAKGFLQTIVCSKGISAGYSL